MRRNKHNNKDIEKALSALENLGWTVAPAKGNSAHSWGYALCPLNKADECRSGIYCRMSIWSTPKDAKKHAKLLLSKAEGCEFRERKDGK